MATIDEVSIIEDGEESSIAVFTVELGTPSGKEITIDYSTVDGTATFGKLDYTATEGTITFAPGETSKTIEVEIIADTLDEIDEAFTLALSNPTNVAIAKSESTATITDNDGPPTVTIDNVTVTEGDESTSNAVFTVSLDNFSSKIITIDYSTEDGLPEDGETAVAGLDYVAQTGTLIFEPGETTKTIEVQILEDTLNEVNENFALALTNPNNVILTDPETKGTGTITDNDQALVLAGYYSFRRYN